MAASWLGIIFRIGTMVAVRSFMGDLGLARKKALATANASRAEFCRAIVPLTTVHLRG